MANRYWVGGAGTWNTTDTTHWSDTSGGVGGASVPVSTDAVFFNSSSGVGVVTMPAGTDVSCSSISTSGFGGTFSVSGATIRVYGSITFSNGLGISGLNLYLYAQGTASFYPGGGNDYSTIEVNSSTAVYTLGSRIRTVNSLTIRSGTLKLSSSSVDAKSVRVTGSSSKLYLGSNTTSVTGTPSPSFIVESSGQIFAETSTVYMRASYAFPFSSNVTFSGGGQTYYNVTLESATETTTTNISGINTVQSLSIVSNGTNTVKFADNSTTNVGSFSLSSAVGIYTTLQPNTPATSTFTLNRTVANTVNLDFVRIQSSTATPANVWYAGSNSVNLGGNTGWVFGADTQAKFNPYFRGCF